MKTPQAHKPTGPVTRGGLRKRAAMLALVVAVLCAQTVGYATNPPPSDALPYSTGYLITGNYIAAGVDLTPLQNPPVNGLATGTISVSGVPANADIVAAFLYYEAISGAGVDPTAGVKFRGATLVPTGIHTSTTGNLGGNNSSVCWGAARGSGSQLTMARADVLHLLPKQFDVNGVWTGRRLVNDADLTSNLDFQGIPYPPHTVTLRQPTASQVIQSAGATLVVIYRNPDDPLRKVVLYDGVYTPPVGGDDDDPLISQTIRGFYKRAGNSGRLTYIAGSGRSGDGAGNQSEKVKFNGSQINEGDPFPQTSPVSDRSWANPTFSVSMSGTTSSLEFGETVKTTLFQNENPKDCKALGAIVFSTSVLDADGDGLPDGLEDAPGGLLNPNGEPLPNLNATGAHSSHKDLFVEVNAMQADPGTTYGSAAAPINPPPSSIFSATDLDGHNHLPTPEVLKMVGDVYAANGITPHFDVGDIASYHALGGDYASLDADSYLVGAGARGGELVRERACVPSPTVDCQFPDYPGTVSWKFGLQQHRDAPVGPNGAELTSAQQDYCQANPTGTIDGIACGRRRFDRNRRSFFHYALYAHARAKPKSPFPCLDSNGNLAEFVNGACSVAINPEFHVPKSVSGSGDLPGGNLMISLGLWDNFVGTPFVQASTTLHELGHNLDLWHGGLPAIWGRKAVNPALSSATYFEPNCKPNYPSSMSYLFQVHGLFLDDDSQHMDYASAPQGAGSPPSINETSLEDGPLGPTTPLYRPAWFVPAGSALATSRLLSAATKFCGSKFNPASPPSPMARAEAASVAESIDWNGDGLTNSAGPQNVNFDATFFNGLTGGAQIVTSALFGFNDWAAIRLNQISAGRGTGRLSEYQGSTFEGSTFEGSTFEGSTFEGSTFEGSTFEGSTFEGSTFEGSTFEGSTFEGSTFEGSTFEGSTFEGSTFEGQEMDFELARSMGRTPPRQLKACVIGTPGCTSAAEFTPLYHRVEVSWKAPTFGHVFGYHVYRITGNDETTKVEVQGSPTTNLTLVDPEELPDGVEFTYFATAEFDDATPHEFSGESRRFSITAPPSPPGAVNDPPVANHDSAYSVNQGTTLTVAAASGVLANDTDTDSPATSLRAALDTAITPPSAGTLTLNANGSFTYVPNPGFSGTATFTYKAFDACALGSPPQLRCSEDSNTATVTITVTAAASANVYLHGTGPNANPPTLFLNSSPPTASTPKFKDSLAVNFAGGNAWKVIGTWTATPQSFTLNSLGDLHAWVGLKNSDDQGTQFDVSAEVYKGPLLVASGLTRCVTGVTRNENLAKEVTVAFAPFTAVQFVGETLSLRVLTRIGTNPDGTKCPSPPGHNNAVGLRLYFDAASRPSRFAR